MHKWEQLQSDEQTKEFALDLLLFSPFTDCLCLLRAFVCNSSLVCLLACLFSRNAIEVFCIG